MTKIKKVFILILAGTLMLFMCSGMTAVAVADTVEPGAPIVAEDNEGDEG